MRKQFFALPALLVFMGVGLLAGGCAGDESGTTPTVEPAREIIITSHHSTRADESAGAPFLDCLKRNFKLPQGVTQSRYGGVALYLSRFYGYTDLFDQAERCDSLVLNYATADRPEGLPYPWYHVAMFSFADQRGVELIRKLENRDTSGLRTRATPEEPGRLDFKPGTECYRVYFAERKVVFFFFQGELGSCREDPELFAAALRLKECLLRPDE